MLSREAKQKSYLKGAQSESQTTAVTVSFGSRPDQTFIETIISAYGLVYNWNIWCL